MSCGFTQLIFISPFLITSRSGNYSNLVGRPLKTGFPHVDAYGESRKSIAFGCVDQYHRRLKQERKRNAEKFFTSFMIQYKSNVDSF